jgi:hypothetical protein
MLHCNRRRPIWSYSVPMASVATARRPSGSRRYAHGYQEKHSCRPSWSTRRLRPWGLGTRKSSRQYLTELHATLPKASISRSGPKPWDGKRLCATVTTAPGIGPRTGRSMRARAPALSVVEVDRGAMVRWPRGLASSTLPNSPERVSCTSPHNQFDPVAKERNQCPRRRHANLQKLNSTGIKGGKPK